MLGRKTGGNHSSKQECDDDIKTTGTPTYGSLRAHCLSQHRGSKYGLVIVDDFYPLHLGVLFVG